MGSQPGSDGSLGNLQAKPFAKKALGLSERVAEIVDRDRLQNVLEGIDSILPRGTGKPDQAFHALEDLECSKAVTSPPLLDGVLGAALWANGIWLLC